MAFARIVARHRSLLRRFLNTEANEPGSVTVGGWQQTSAFLQRADRETPRYSRAVELIIQRRSEKQEDGLVVLFTTPARTVMIDLGLIQKG